MHIGCDLPYDESPEQIREFCQNVAIDRVGPLGDGCTLMAPTGMDADDALRLAEALHAPADDQLELLQGFSNRTGEEWR